MITLKIKPYSKFEVEVLHNLLADSLAHLQANHCENTCDDCPVNHVCVDLQSAELFARDTVKFRRATK